MNAGNLPGSVTEGGGGSVLQAMLRDYLTHNKEVLFGEGCSFVKSRLIARLPAPPTIDAVMALACEADIDTCAVRLATMAGVFEKLLPPSAAESKDRDTAYQASLRLLLVLSERYVRSTEAGNQYLARRHEPVWTQDSLLSCVLAAARLGFGLSFKAGRRDPLNVIDAKPAASEFGNPGETGYGLVHAEALAALERLLKGETSPPPEPAAVPIGKPYFDARRGDLQDDIRDKLGADPVLRVEEVGDYAQEDKRQALQDYLAPFALPTFFRTGKEVSVPDWAKPVLGELSNVFNAAFAASIDREKESEDMGNQGKDGARGHSTHNHFHGQVGQVVTGDKPQVAGRDIINHSPVWQEVSGSLAALRDAIAALPDDTPQKKQLLADFEDVHEVVRTGEPDEGRAKLVKRCLDGLKQGAEAVENGSTIIEKLTPAAIALAAAWPGIVSWIS